MWCAWKDFVGLKSKIYTFIAEDNHESKEQKALIKMLLVIS